MRGHRPAETEVIDGVEHQRVGIERAVYFSTNRCRVARVLPVAVFSLEPPRVPLVAEAGADIETIIERLVDGNGARLAGYRIGTGDAAFRALQACPAALAAEIKLRPRRGRSQYHAQRYGYASHQ